MTLQILYLQTAIKQIQLRKILWKLRKSYRNITTKCNQNTWKIPHTLTPLTEDEVIVLNQTPTIMEEFMPIPLENILLTNTIPLLIIKETLLIVTLALTQIE